MRQLYHSRHIAELMGMFREFVDIKKTGYAESSSSDDEESKVNACVDKVY